ncbi:uncharacterized protein IL334_003631 [Kwoniella shivajii]|uniref:Uncharacterized protein n=1 Tax=Kwoniella shivajii TaxID=564305 RepID=A0ABZ1CY39_9TREE|nr:hypothetical protein IL334_003631 [Kwoniella shivajii]
MLIDVVSFDEDPAKQSLTVHVNGDFYSCGFAEKLVHEIERAAITTTLNTLNSATHSKMTADDIATMTREAIYLTAQKEGLKTQHQQLTQDLYDRLQKQSTSFEDISKVHSSLQLPHFPPSTSFEHDPGYSRTNHQVNLSLTPNRLDDIINEAAQLADEKEHEAEKRKKAAPQVMRFPSHRSSRFDDFASALNTSLQKAITEQSELSEEAYKSEFDLSQALYPAVRAAFDPPPTISFYRSDQNQTVEPTIVELLGLFKEDNSSNFTRTESAAPSSECSAGQ